jgi:hypothetical protein
MGAYSYGHQRWIANQYGPRTDRKRRDTGRDIVNVGRLEIVEQRGGAWLTRIADKLEYLPRSQVSILEDGTATMPRWLAKKYALQEQAVSGE